MYEHMDSISVKKWDIIKKWSKIWTVWNTWNTFWWLWWYHVHFEIDKSTQWRQAYVYEWCTARKNWKSHYEIIQNWLCRLDLFRNTYDPIKLLEESNAILPTEIKHWSAINTSTWHINTWLIIWLTTTWNTTEINNKINLDLSKISDPVAKHFFSLMGLGFFVIAFYFSLKFFLWYS